MKHRKVIVLALLMLIVVVLVLCSCDDGMYHAFEYRKIIKEKYGMEEILCEFRARSISGFTVDGQPYFVHELEDEYSRYYDYVYGVKDGEGFAVIFPQYHSEKVCLSKWVFDISFEETVCELQSVTQSEIFNTEGRVVFSHLNSLYDYDEMVRLVPEMENMQLDVPMMLIFDRSEYVNEQGYITLNYAIVQSQGQLRIFHLTEQCS